MRIAKGRLIFFTVAVWTALANSASALYSKSDAVVELTASNFDELVMRPDGVALVEFYAPWCGHCQQLAPQYKKVASNLQGLALVGAVDCNDQAKNADLCLKRFKLRGFPTIMVFGPDKTKNPYTGEFTKEYKDYEGPRTAKPMVDAVAALLTDGHISRLRSAADLAQFVKEAGGKPQALLFTTKTESSLLYKSLSTQLHRRVAFAEVHGASAPHLVAEFGVADLPALLVVKADGTREVYGGELKAPALLKYLSSLGGGTSGSSSGADGQEGGEPGSGAGKGKSGAGSADSAFVRQVYDLSELPALEEREDMALLALHGAEGPDGCQEARSAFLAAAAEMQAVVDTLLVSVPAGELTHGSEGAEALGRLGVDVAALAADPCELQVVLLPLGKDKADLDDYQKYSGPPDGKSLQRWVTDSIPAYFVTRVDDMSGGAFLSLDPSRGRMSVAPKVVLFTNKDEPPGLFRALAMAFRNRGNLLFGFVPVGSPHAKMTVKGFTPTKVPSMTVIVAAPPEEGGGGVAEGSMRFGQQPYFGPLKYGPMRAFLEQLATGVEASSGVVDDPGKAEKVLPQIASQTDLERHCTSKTGLCLLALLESTAPSYDDERQALLKTALKAEREGGAFHFAWMEGRRHRGVLEAFGVLPSDMPTLVALSAKRMRFAVLPAPEEAKPGARLNPDYVSRFIDGVLGGKIRTQPLQDLPDISSGDGASPAAAAADAPAPSGGEGGAAAEAADAAPLEEEFDLSDIMSEEVEGGVSGAKADRLREVEEQLKAEEEARKAAEAAAKQKKASKKKKGKKGSSKKGKAASGEEL